MITNVLGKTVLATTPLLVDARAGTINLNQKEAVSNDPSVSYAQKTIDKLFETTKIFQSSKLPRKDEKGNLARDMKCGDLAEAEVDAALRYWSIEGFKTWFVAKKDWDNLTILSDGLIKGAIAEAKAYFANHVMDAVVEDMFMHFYNGSGSDYENIILTDRVFSHTSTINYLSGLLTYVKKAISDVNGDIHKMKCVGKEKDDHYRPLYNNIQDHLSFPSFSDDRFIGGLQITINDTWGNAVWIEDYHLINNKKYYGILYIDLYDHFGLDETDLYDPDDPNNISKSLIRRFGPFPQWFTLQRWEKFNKKHKPFVTRIPLRVYFSGEI